MIMQIFEDDYFFEFFVLPFFQKKHKIKQSRDQNDLFINDGKYMKQKIPTQVQFHLRRDERIFFLKAANNKQTHYLNR